MGLKVKQLRAIADAPDGEKVKAAASVMLEKPLDMIRMILQKKEEAVIEVLAEQMREIERLRDHIDRCYKMLLSEPDTQGALFKAENILRDALEKRTK